MLSFYKCFIGKIARGPDTGFFFIIIFMERETEAGWINDQVHIAEM